eukprot:TRINITY_DN2359_c1_g1_i2.p1 TRINITY_DN2359_c1_g1~~TRINITY_DN2359_c1_g1_i2.p1  ORF type:complete len:2245 (-),score=566.54 TRINITY_DN2359_c1_g1_i2:77-6811(-)
MCGAEPQQRLSVTAPMAAGRLSTGNGRLSTGAGLARMSLAPEGDDLDIDSLEARADERIVYSKSLWAALQLDARSTELRSPKLLKGGSVPPELTEDGRIRFRRRVCIAAPPMLQSWAQDVTAALPPATPSSSSKERLQSLRRLHAEREASQHQVRVFEARREKAMATVVTLSTQMQDRSPRIVQSAAIQQTPEKKKKRFLGKAASAFKKQIGKGKHKDKHGGDADDEVSGTVDHDDTLEEQLQEANDELVETTELLEMAQMKLDETRAMCERATQAVMQDLVKEERSVYGSGRTATHTAVLTLKGWGNHSVDSAADKSSAMDDAGWRDREASEADARSPRATLPHGIEESEEHLETLSEATDELWQTFLMRRPGRGLGFMSSAKMRLSDVAVQPADVEERQETLRKANEQTERMLRHRRPRHLGQRLRRAFVDFEREVARLESVAHVAAAQTAPQMSAGKAVVPSDLAAADEAPFGRTTSGGSSSSKAASVASQKPPLAADVDEKRPSTPPAESMQNPFASPLATAAVAAAPAMMSGKTPPPTVLSDSAESLSGKKPLRRPTALGSFSEEPSDASVAGMVSQSSGSLYPASPAFGSNKDKLSPFGTADLLLSPRSPASEKNPFQAAGDGDEVGGPGKQLSAPTPLLSKPLNPFAEEGESGESSPQSDGASEKPALADAKITNGFKGTKRSEQGKLGKQHGLLMDELHAASSPDSASPAVNPFASDVSTDGAERNPFAMEEPPLTADVVSKLSNPFAAGKVAETNPFGDGSEDEKPSQPRVSKPFSEDMRKSRGSAGGGANPFEADGGPDASNPFDDEEVELSTNPFGAADSDTEREDDDTTNPFAAGDVDASPNPFDDESSEEGDSTLAAAAATAGSEHMRPKLPIPKFGADSAAPSADVTPTSDVSPEPQPQPQTRGERRQFLTGDRKDIMSEDLLRFVEATDDLWDWKQPAEMPDMSTRTVRNAKVGLEFRGLLGCLPHGVTSDHGVHVHGAPLTNRDPTIEKALKVSRPELALAQSDISLLSERLAEERGYWNWEWRDIATEEKHSELHRCTHSMATAMSDEDWNLFAYESLLLAHAALSEPGRKEEPRRQSDEAAARHVRAILQDCRVSLGITSLLHHHLAEITLPDGEQDYFALDVRYRAAVLLRSWAAAAWASTGLSLQGSGTAKFEWTLKWVRRQLSFLRVSAIMRGTQAVTADDAVQRELHFVASACVIHIRFLDELAATGFWGSGPADKENGRKVLVSLMQSLDRLNSLAMQGQPRDSASHWRIDTVSAARIFSCLWSAAVAPPTADLSEDRLTPEAPTVAAALLSGLHSSIGTVPLSLETHAMLLAQHIWTSLAEHVASSPGSPGMAPMQLKAEDLAAASQVLEDFTTWLQENSEISSATYFARRDLSETVSNEAVELVSRRVLSVDLRDGLTKAMQDYRRHFEPEAFGPAVELWWRAQAATTLTKQLMEAIADSASSGGSPTASPDVVAQLADESGIEEYCKKMSRWFIWSTVRTMADQALSEVNEPLKVPKNDPAAWAKMGAKIKKKMDAVTAALKSLLDEFQCEKEFYHEAWEKRGLGKEHLGIVASALRESARPVVLDLLQSGVWPTGTVKELPAGGGRLLQALEELDRLAGGHPAPSAAMKHHSASPLVDLIVPHITVALEKGFVDLDRDYLSHALKGSDDLVFQMLRPPTLIHCDGVVTLWRLIHDSLDAPLSLGINVDIVVPPFINLLHSSMDRVERRLARQNEKRELFRMRARAAQVSENLASSADLDLDDEEDDLDTTGGGDEPKKKKRGWKRNLSRMMGSTRTLTEEPTKNDVMDAAALDVDVQVVGASIQQVCIRIASLGFCIKEMTSIYKQTHSLINKGDDVNNPTVRHNDARRQVVQELPELMENLQNQGGSMVGYLAARLVYWELKSDLFEKMYFKYVAPPDRAMTPTTPRKGSTDASTPRKSSAELEEDDGMETPVLTFEAILQQCEAGFLSIAATTPAPFMLAFVLELGTQLCNAWSYVVLDYLRRGKLDLISEYLDDDQEMLRRFLNNLVKEARRHIEIYTAEHGQVVTDYLHSLSPEDCDKCQEKVHGLQEAAQELVLKTNGASNDDMTRYAFRVMVELEAGGGGAQERAMTPNRSGSRGGGGSSTPRQHSPVTSKAARGAAGSRGRSLSPSAAAAVAASDMLSSSSERPGTAGMNRPGSMSASGNELSGASSGHEEGGGDASASSKSKKSFFKALTSAPKNVSKGLKNLGKGKHS